jgi:histidyl-tRNA synthetase
MARQRYKAPRGTADILPEDQPYWRLLREAATRVATSFGYRQIETPVFEDAGVFLRPSAGGTDIVDKEVYLFRDRGGNELALRPEGTAAVCRAYLEHGMASLPQPVRLFYIVPIFRYDRPQAGRYRLHHQFGVEAIGDPDAAIDAETIDLLSTLFDAVGLTGASLYVNSIGDPACRPAYLNRLRAYYADRLDRLCADCRVRYDRAPLRLLDCKSGPCQPFKADAPAIADSLCDACRDHFAALRRYLDALGIAHTVDPRLVRGLDYYTRTVFEFQPKEEGSQSAIAAGGRYDGLMEELGGPPTPAAGFGSGIERLILNLKRQGIRPEVPEPPDALVAPLDAAAQAKAMLLARDLRRRGLTVVLGSAARSLKAQLRQAGGLGARYALILGPEEVAAGSVTLRDLAAATQERLPFAAAAERIAIQR